MKELFNYIIVYLKIFSTRFFTIGFRRLDSARNIRYLKEHDDCIILGNGPSLKNDIEGLLSPTTSQSRDYICVNHFAELEFYELIKPTKYFILDPYFWVENAHEELVTKRELLFNALNEKTNWNMQIFISAGADLNFFHEKVKNKFIQIIKIPTLAMPVIHDPMIVDIYLNGKYGPPRRNVLIYCVYTAIINGYKNIKIFGADLSFTEDVKVNQEDNSLYIKYRHCYGELKTEKMYENPDRVRPTRMQSLYRTTYEIFYSHDILNEMARAENIKITNCSSYSLIDSYDRE